MTRLRLCLLGIVLSTISPGPAAHAQDDREVLRQSIEALRRAPAYRVTVTEAGGAAPELQMEVVSPDLLHLRTGMGTEVYSDGRTTVSRDGASGPFADARGSVGAQVAMARQMATPDALLQTATSVRFAGHSAVGGVPASVYAVDALFLGMRVDARVWVSDADRRPLRTEGEVNGEVRFGGRPGRHVHRSAVVTYEYDPSIKIVMPRS